MKIPSSYIGREPTFLKHRVLQLYLEGWGCKLGSIARKRPVRLWYIDCFSGPWKSADSDLRDTSIHIGLDALEMAAATWVKRGFPVEVGAVFVEQNKAAFDELRAFLARRNSHVPSHPLHGSFGDRVSDIQQLVGSDPALLFIDPTGWDGVAIRFIATLARVPRRDVIVNMMFDHINRFKDDPRIFIREQMRHFFGAEIPPRLTEHELLALYRSLLKSRCGLEFSADLAVPYSTQQRTKFRLVVGGHQPAVVRLFRDVERKIMGAEAAAVRAGARDRRREERDSQLALLPSQAPAIDPTYAAAQAEGMQQAQSKIVELLGRGPALFGDLWPQVLEDCHITHADLATEIWRLARAGRLTIEGSAPRERVVKDHHRLRLGSRSLASD